MPKKNEQSEKRELAELSYRNAELEVVSERDEAGEIKSQSVRTSVSSEIPYYRNYMWDEKSRTSLSGYEVLGHAEGEIDFSRMKDGLVIQDTHYGDQIGIMRNPHIENGKITGDIDFGCGSRAQEIKADALAGIRRNMSVGYTVQIYKDEGLADDGKRIYRAVRWTPHEASFVNVPVDSSVGVGREYTDKNGGSPAVVKNTKGTIMTPDQVLECLRLARAGEVEHAEFDDLVKSGKSFEEVREVLVGKLEAKNAELRAAAAKAAEKHEDKPAMPAPAAGRAIVDEKTAVAISRRYNLANVLRSLAGDTNVDVGYEREISDEMVRQTGRKGAQGIIVPDFIRAAANAADGALTLGTPAYNLDTTAGGITGIGGNGAATIATNLLAGSFIEALRDTLVLSGAGMQTLSGLTGNIEIPKGGKATAAWVSTENGDATKTNPTFGQVAATPHSVGAYTDITRKLLLQSSIDVQAFVVRELVYAIAYALENAAFNGAGSSGEPLGLVSQVPVGNTVSFAPDAPTLAKVFEMVATIDAANGTLGPQTFIGRPAVWARFASTFDIATISDETNGTVGGVTSGRYLLDAVTNTMQGYRFLKSNIAPAKKLLFGDFSQLTLCLWSGTDLVVDQYSNCTKGALRVVALQDADFIVRQPEAFAVGTTVLS